MHSCVSDRCGEIEGGGWLIIYNIYQFCHPCAVQMCWVSQHWLWDADRLCVCFTPPPTCFPFFPSLPMSVCLLPDSQVCQELNLPSFPPCVTWYLFPSFSPPFQVKFEKKWALNIYIHLSIWWKDLACPKALNSIIYTSAILLFSWLLHIAYSKL